ncbi:MAG: hypothetical protein Q9201_005501 [Fulgogasparrea decipioides]
MRLKNDDPQHVRSWTDQNPDHRFELLTDGGAETYVKDGFSDDEKVLHTYLSLQDFIMRADLIRYLVLLRDGGVYNDVDVGCLRPIDLWIPSKFKDNTSVVLGIEVDNEMGPNGSKLFELVNWTIMARPNAPFMRYLVDRVIKNLEVAAFRHNTTLYNLRPKRQEVIDVTGPMALTQAAFQYLSQKTGTTVNMQNFTKMRQPKLVADVLVLPINAFGAGHQVDWSGADQDGSALVHHYFAGSWKTNHFDGPTEEEKKAAEEKKKVEEEKKKEDEAKKVEEEKKKKDEAKKKAEEEQRKAEEEQKKAEAEKQKAEEETKKMDEDDKQAAANAKNVAEIQKDSDTLESDSKNAVAETLSSEEAEELERLAVQENEKQQAIEDLQRVNIVRQKTREDGVRKMEEERRKAEEARRKDEEAGKQNGEAQGKPGNEVGQSNASNTASNEPAQGQGQPMSGGKPEATENIQQAT